MATNNLPSVNLLKEHIHNVHENPETPLNESLFRVVGAELNDGHGVVVDLILKLLRTTSFTECLAYTSADGLLAAVRSPVPSVNLLALRVLSKSCRHSSDAALVAGMRELVLSTVQLWLETPTIEVAEEASRALFDLLRIDLPSSMENLIASKGNLGDDAPQNHGQGLVWRRMFGDKDVYRLLFSTCSLTEVGDPGHLNAAGTSIAQGRLLGFLAKLSILSFSTIEGPHFPEIERKFRVPPQEGLLYFACKLMIDTNDVLMVMNLFEFFTDLLKSIPSTPEGSASINTYSPSLRFLRSRGFHGQAVRPFFNESSNGTDDIFLELITPRSANYIAALCTFHQAFVLTESDDTGKLFVEKIKSQIQTNLANSSGGASDKAISYNLNILVSLPRTRLIPQAQGNSKSARTAAWLSSPLSDISNASLRVEHLQALGHIFHGPFNPESERLEAVAARALYTIFISRSPNFWKRVVKIAESIVFPETALAAIELLNKVITSNWMSSPVLASGEKTTELPDEELIFWSNDAALPISPEAGSLAMLHPPALEYVMPYLMAPSKLNSSIEGEGYRIGLARFDVLEKLHKSLEQADFGEQADVETLRQALSRRVARGPWGEGMRIASVNG